MNCEKKNNLCKKVKEKVSEKLFLLVELFILAIIIFILSITPVGNLLRCKLFDAQGCKPKIKIEVNIIGDENRDHSYIEKNYRIIDKPRNLDLNRFVLMAYIVSLKNKGYESIENLTLKVRPLLGSKTNHPRIIGYRMIGEKQDLDVPYDTIEKSLLVTSKHFVDESWLTRWTLTWEEAKIKILIGYPIKLYNNSSNNILMLEVKCEGCQAAFVKKLISKGREN